MIRTAEDKSFCGLFRLRADLRAERCRISYMAENVKKNVKKFVDNGENFVV